MKDPIPNDDELVRMLAGPVEQRKKALYYLFADDALRAQVIAYIRNHGGNRDDGQEAMHEAVVIFDKNIRSGRYKGDGSLRGYFFGIVKWWWYSKQRSHNPTLELKPDMYDSGVESHEELMITNERIAGVREALDTIGERCLRILTLWGQKEPMEKIAEAMDFKDSHAAKREAYRCRERIIRHIKSNPRLRDQVGL